MIARVRPSYSSAELRAALGAGPDAVVSFERELAAHFGMRHALTFPYGRSAIYACLSALGRVGEVVQPAYNCVVVAHAAVVAGSRPVFVDSETESPNQDPAQMADSVNERTVAVVPTSIFGIPFDAAALCEAIRRRNRDAFILMDCCQSFDARWRGAALAAQGDATVLAFGIGKPMTTLYGGALLTDRDDVAQTVRGFRDARFRRRRPYEVAARWAYFLATWLAFSNSGARLTDLLEHLETPLHRYLKGLRARDAIRLPRDNTNWMLPMEAAVGRVQLRRVADFIARRRAIAAIYARELGDVAGLELLDWPDGSSFAIYAARVRDQDMRERILAAMRAGGIQGDTTLSYVVPELACYRDSGYGGGRFPNALSWSRSVINLPSHPRLGDREVLQVARVVRDAFDAPSTVRTGAGAAAA